MKTFKTLLNIVTVFGIGAIVGAIYEDYLLANDKDYHDYWMKRMKEDDPE